MPSLKLTASLVVLTLMSFSALGQDTTKDRSLLTDPLSGKVVDNISRMKEKLLQAAKITFPVDSNSRRKFLNNAKNNLKIDVSSNIPLPYFDTIINSFKESVKSKIKLITDKKSLKINIVDAHVNYNYIMDTSSLTTTGSKTTAGFFAYHFEGGITAGSIPFVISYGSNNGFYTSGQSSFHDFYKANFDVEKYREILQGQVLKKIKPEIVLGSIIDHINNIRRQYEKHLQNEIKGVQNDYFNHFQEHLNLPVNVTDLSKPDLSDMSNKLLQNDLLEKYNENTVRYQEILKGKHVNIQDTALVRQLLKDFKRFEALQRIQSKLLEAKDKFENNKLVKELRSHLPFTPGKFSTYLKDPKKLTEVIKNHASLSALQNIFLNITKLDLGQNPVENGEFSVQSLLNTGINTSFNSAKSSIGIIAGKNNNVNTWLQSGLNSIVTNEYSGLFGLKIGRGSLENPALSINVYNFTRTPGSTSEMGILQPSYLSTAKRQDAVITYNAAFKIGERHDIKVDLSKSFGSYKNDITSAGIAGTKNLVSSLFTNQGKLNYAAAIHYNGEILNTGLQMYIKKVGLGYNNPGNIFLRKGESQMQIGLFRKLLKQKVTVNYNFDYRNQHFDPGKSYRYTTLTNKVRLKLRIKKNNRVGILYQRSNYQYKMYAQPVSNSLSYLLQADGSYTFKAFMKPIINTVSVSSQNMKLPLAVGSFYNSKSFLLVYSSSMIIKNNLLVFSVTGNHSNNKDYYYNSSFFNTEASYACSLSTRFQLTSGTGYYVNSGWNSQIGFKQQLTISILKKVDIDISVDCKRAVRIIRTQLANQLFVNASAYYRF